MKTKDRRKDVLGGRSRCLRAVDGSIRHWKCNLKKLMESKERGLKISSQAPWVHSLMAISDVGGRESSYVSYGGCDCPLCRLFKLKCSSKCPLTLIDSGYRCNDYGSPWKRFAVDSYSLRDYIRNAKSMVKALEEARDYVVEHNL